MTDVVESEDPGAGLAFGGNESGTFTTFVGSGAGVGGGGIGEVGLKVKRKGFCVGSRGGKL